jgi:vacuolar-type H+-ATPase subunit E/Vma4
MNLTTLRAALLAEAEDEAERLNAEARAAAKDRLVEAERRAAAFVAAAREEGEQAAVREGRRRLAAGRREAGELRLRAQRALLEAVRAGARDGALALREDRRYPRLLEQLEQAVVAQLGEGAELEVDPPGVGGIVGRAGSVGVDYTLPALADRALDALGGELTELWA